MTVTDGLAHHWRFDEGDGTLVGDVVGVAPLTLSSASVWGKKAQDGSATPALTATDAATSSAVTSPGSAWTAAVVVRPDKETWASGSNFRDVLRHTGANSGWALGFGSSGFRFASSGSSTVSYNMVLTFDYWIVVQLRFSAGVLTMRLGDFVQTIAGTFTPPVSGTQFKVGGGAITRIADVLYYPDRALSDTEMATNHEGLLERVNGSITLDTFDAATAVEITPTPFDTRSTEAFRGLYGSPLATADGLTYVAEITGSTGQVQGAIAKLDSTTLTELQRIDPFSTGHSHDVGHTEPSVGIDQTGRVFFGVGRNDESWEVFRTDNPHDLSAVSAVPAPFAGLKVTYLNFTRHPISGELFACYRHTTFDADGSLFDYLSKWDVDTQSWVNLGNPIQGDIGDSGYQPMLTFSRDGTVAYFAYEVRRGGAGAPRGPGAVIKSVDGCVTWTTVDDTPVTLPVTTSTATAAFPRTNRAANDLIVTKLVVDPDGHPLLAANWQNQYHGDVFESAWVARWSPIAESFTYHRLLRHPAGQSVGYINMIPDVGGALAVVVSAERDHLTGGAPFYLFTTSRGQVWRRSILAAESVGITVQRLAVDRSAAYDGTVGKARIRPAENTFTVSRLWEFSLVAPPPNAAIEQWDGAQWVPLGVEQYDGADWREVTIVRAEGSP